MPKYFLYDKQCFIGNWLNNISLFDSINDTEIFITFGVKCTKSDSVQNHKEFLYERINHFCCHSIERKKKIKRGEGQVEENILLKRENEPIS